MTSSHIQNWVKQKNMLRNMWMVPRTLWPRFQVSLGNGSPPWVSQIKVSVDPSCTGSLTLSSNLPCSDRMMGVEGGTEINLKSALDMSTKHGLLYIWMEGFRTWVTLYLEGKLWRKSSQDLFAPEQWASARFLAIKIFQSTFKRLFKNLSRLTEKFS